MDVTVTMASGEVDEWEACDDTVVDHGAMVVVSDLEEELAGEFKGKTLTVKEGQKSRLFQVHAIYAPGMWIKVEYQAELEDPS